MKKNIIADAVKRTYADINRINGYVKYTRNSSYGFTAKVEYMQIVFNDNTCIEINNSGKKHIHSGCGYNKPEHAIHCMLSEYITSIPSTCNFPIDENYHMNGSDFFRSHLFSATNDNPENMFTINIF